MHGNSSTTPSGTLMLEFPFSRILLFSSPILGLKLCSQLCLFASSRVARVGVYGRRFLNFWTIPMTPLLVGGASARSARSSCEADEFDRWRRPEEATMGRWLGGAVVGNRACS